MLTVLGLAATFQQARQARKSADLAGSAAQEAAERVRQSIAKVDTMRTLELSITLIDRIYEHQSRSSWERVPEFYKDLRGYLAEVQGEVSALPVADKRYIQQAVSELATIERDIQEKRLGREKVENAAEMNQIITEHRDRFITMRMDLGRRDGI